MKSQEVSFASFSYCLWPELKNASTTDWELLVTDDVVQSQNIYCHELKAGEHLSKIIAHHRHNHSVALIVVNTRNDYIIEKSFLGEMEGEEFPVVVLTEIDGRNLLKAFDDHVRQHDDVQVRIMSRSAVGSEVRPQEHQSTNTTVAVAKTDPG